MSLHFPIAHVFLAVELAKPPIVPSILDPGRLSEANRQRIDEHLDHVSETGQRGHALTTSAPFISADRFDGDGFFPEETRALNSKAIGHQLRDGRGFVERLKTVLSRKLVHDDGRFCCF
jgi:hypothetical protein